MVAIALYLPTTSMTVGELKSTQLLRWSMQRKCVWLVVSFTRIITLLQK
jgi:hypothetical protein